MSAAPCISAGVSAFVAGSAACAAAPSLGVLIAARAVQGLGASALLPCSLALLVHQFPDPRSRARALGVWGAMGSLGVALGAWSSASARWPAAGLAWTAIRREPSSREPSSGLRA